MKKFLFVILSFLSIQAFAKGSSHVNDNESTQKQSSCFIYVNDTNVTRLVNAAYIRTIYLKNNSDNRNENLNVVYISMASNYGVPDSLKHFAIQYGSRKEAEDALRAFQNSVNTCQ